MRAFGGTHQWKMGFDFSYIPFEGDNTGSPLGSWTFPRDVPYDANDRTTWPTLYTELAADLREHPGEDLRRVSAGRLAGGAAA